VKLQAAAADGDVVLGVENDVARWVDAQGSITIRSGTVVRSRVSSLHSIALDREIAARSLYAPVIVTAEFLPKPIPGRDYDGEGSAPLSKLEALPQEGPLPDGRPSTSLGALSLSKGGSDQAVVPAYLAGLRCSRLEPRTWLVQGDLSLSAETRVEENLVVRGKLTSGPACLFRGDVKAAYVKLGPRNRVRGNLVSDGSLEVGEASFAERNLAAGKDIRLRAGTRVGAANRLAAISAGGEILLEENVAVCGKAAAGQWIRTV
jgi:predicted acyltransferase (DUF342 family)